MPLAKDLALELRKFVENLEKNPDLKIPEVHMYAYVWDINYKQEWINLVRCIPKPLAKVPTDSDFKIIYDSPSVKIQATIPRNLVCTLVTPAQPAIYKCDPIFSDEEENEVIDSTNAAILGAKG